jgi:hypothetical protein
LAKESSTDFRSAGFRAGRTEGFIALDHKHFRPDALEGYDSSAARLAAIEGRYRFEPSPAASPQAVENVGVEAGDLEEQIAAAVVPVQREIAVEPLHPGGALFDALRASSRLVG